MDVSVGVGVGVSVGVGVGVSVGTSVSVGVGVSVGVSVRLGVGVSIIFFLNHLHLLEYDPSKNYHLFFLLNLLMVHHCQNFLQY